MDKFKQFRKDVEMLKTTDQKVVSYIETVKKYIDSKEKYYNNIPDKLRTSNIADMIYIDIDKRIKQLNRMVNVDVEREAYIAQLEAAYVEQIKQKRECEEDNVITHAYLTNAENSLQFCEDKNANLNKDVSQKNANIVNLDGKIAKLNEDVSQKTDDIVGLEKQLVASNAENMILEDKIKTMEDDISELTNKDQQHNKLIKDLETQIYDEKANEKTLLSKIEICNEEKQVLVDSENTLKQTIKQLEQELETKKQEMENSAAANDDGIGKLNEQIQDLENSLKDKKSELDKCKTEINKLQLDINNLRETIIKNNEKELKLTQELSQCKQKNIQLMNLSTLKTAFDEGRYLGEITNINKKINLFNDKGYKKTDFEQLNILKVGIAGEVNKIIERLIDSGDANKDAKIADFKSQIEDIVGDMKPYYSKRAKGGDESLCSIM